MKKLMTILVLTTAGNIAVLAQTNFYTNVTNLWYQGYKTNVLTIANTRLMANSNERDTCGISRFNPGDGTDYSNYVSYGDQELFCRVQQNGILGDAAKDWAFGGAQFPKN